MLCFHEGRAPERDQKEEVDLAELIGDGRVLACGRCLQAITTQGARIEVGGSHEHVRSNPAGIVHRFGCFAVAPGCAAVGNASTYFTWFPGYAWQVEHCARCNQHLGWLFSSLDHRFHGLILDLLVEVEEE